MKDSAITMILAAVLSTMFSGCGPSAANTSFKDTVQSFTQQLRWGRLEGAALFIEPKNRSAWLNARRGQTQGIKITDMQIIRVHRGGRLGDEGTVDLRVAWYSQDTMTVKQADWRQKWKMTSGNWLVIDESRVLKPEVVPTKNTASAWP